MRTSMLVAASAAISLCLAGCAGDAGSTGQSSPNDAAASDHPIEGASGSQSLAPQSGGYDMSEVWLERDGMRIYGRLYTPNAQQGRSPLVILSHGFGGSSEIVAAYAQAFAEAGIAAYVFDFIGGGPDSRSDGDTTEMSVLTEAADLNAVLDAMIARDDVDTDRVFLFGESQGGFVSSYVAGMRPDEVAGLIALYPAYVLQEDARARAASGADIPDEATFMGVSIGRVYTEDALSFDIFDVIADYDRDVLIVHGTADPIVPISYSERAIGVFPSAELVPIKGAGHGFSGGDEHLAARLAIEFVQDKTTSEAD